MTEAIKVLGGLEHIRLRSGMYVGDAATPDTLLKEFTDNAIDELLNGHCDRIDIDINSKEGWFRVRDNGRGLPLAPFKTDDPSKSGLNGEVSAKLLFSEMYSGGKYDKANYTYSSGLNGLGLTICNALSQKLTVRVQDKKNVQKGKQYNVEFSQGNLVSESFTDPDPAEDIWWSTELTIYPDLEIFRSAKVTLKEIQLQLARSARPQSTINVNGKPVNEFSFKDSVESELVQGTFNKVKATLGTSQFEIMFGWTSKAEFNTIQRGAVNLGAANEGFHVNETKAAIGRALSSFNSALVVPDGHLGLRVFVNALVSEPEYTGQTKEKLSWIKDFDRANEELINSKYADLITYDTNNKPDLRAARTEAQRDKDWQGVPRFFSIVEHEVKKALQKDEQYTDLIIKRIIEYKKSVQSLSEQNYINSIVKTGDNKLTRASVAGIYEATSADRGKCELFICEGKSAMGGMQQTRDQRFQALMPLRGKPLNATKKNDIKEILENAEMKTLINGIGVGLYPNVNLQHARYGKIIIVTDADFDGYNIEALVIGALTYLCPDVIKGGLLYIAEAPLFKQGGKFVYNESDLDKKKDFDRFKGLGTMEPEDLAKAVLDVKTRKLTRVTLEETREKVLDIITSSAEKKRIMTNAGLLIE